MKFIFWLYLLVRYIRIAIISVPIMLLFFVLPHLVPVDRIILKSPGTFTKTACKMAGRSPF